MKIECMAMYNVGKCTNFCVEIQRVVEKRIDEQPESEKFKLSKDGIMLLRRNFGLLNEGGGHKNEECQDKKITSTAQNDRQ